MAVSDASRHALIAASRSSAQPMMTSRQWQRHSHAQARACPGSCAMISCISRACSRLASGVP
ncbi:MAG: hypothetical protein ACE368_03655 [Paracoccaceae bacterium]